MDLPSTLAIERELESSNSSDSELSDHENDKFYVKDEKTGEFVDLRAVIERNADKDAKDNDSDGLFDEDLVERREMGSFEEDFNGDKDGDVATAWDGYWKNRRERQQRLWAAATEGDFEVLDELLQSPENVSGDLNAQRDSDKFTALHMAASAGHVECCALLLNKGASLNALSTEGQTPFHVAAVKGQIGVVGQLLQHTQGPRIAAHTLVNTQDERGNTALHAAALSGHEAICRMLVRDGGASARIKNNFSQTPVGCCLERATMDAISEEVKRRVSLRKARKATQVPSQPAVGASTVTTAGGSTVRASTEPGKDGVEDLGSRLFAELDLDLEGPEEVPEYSRTRFHNTLMHNSRQDVINRFMHMHSAPQATNSAGSVNMRRFNAVSPGRIQPAASHLQVPTSAAPATPATPALPLDDHAVSAQGTPTPTPSANRFKPLGRQLVSLRSEDAKVLGPEDYTVKALLGQGSFGEVYKVQLNDEPSKLFALKVLRKDKVFGRNLQRYATTERNVLTYSKHPFIVGLHHAFQTTDHLALVLEFCPGGNLQQLIARCRRLKEAVARLYAAEILLALEFLHHRKVIYRDLKPENVVLDAQGHVKLTDFGLAKESVQLGVHKTHSFCGSVAYLAPEMLRKEGHDGAVDIYGLGVLLYEMLVGVPAYYSPDKNQLFKNIQSAPLRIPSHVSPHAASLIRALLERDPAKRLGVADPSEIKNHPFFAGLDFNALLKKDFAILPLAMNPSVQDALTSGFKEAHVPLAPLLFKKEHERDAAIKQGGEAGAQALALQKEAQGRVADHWTYIATE